ncbi:MAG TPA: aminotransferase class V-fold PLP-dependent enzyme [Candidatus Acidoferrales bacterium]
MNAWRDAWFDFGGAAYLNVAAQGPMPRVALRAVQQALEWKKFPHLLPESTYFDLPNRVRASLARIIGARAEEIAITTGTSSGLAAIAAGLDWEPDDEVLIAKGEFPAHFAAFLPLAQAGKLRVKIVEPRGRFLDADDFLEQMGPRTRLVSASLVRFDNAARLDSVRVADACHQGRALLALDAAQCAGAMPINVAELGADFLTASGYKWLLGPYGAGFLWVRPERVEQMRPSAAYWMAFEDAEKFHTLSAGDFQLAPGARRWDSPETASFFNLAGFDASLEFLLGVGVETVWQHNQKLIAEIIERLPRDRCVLASPADAAARGPYICVAPRNRENTPALFERLREAGVFVSLREGALRISPYLYNSERDIDRLLSVLSV